MNRVSCHLSGMEMIQICQDSFDSVETHSIAELTFQFFSTGNAVPGMRNMF